MGECECEYGLWIGVVSIYASIYLSIIYSTYLSVYTETKESPLTNCDLTTFLPSATPERAQSSSAHPQRWPLGAS